MSIYSYIILAMKITPKQSDTLRAIHDSISTNGIAPTLKELRVKIKASSDQSVVQFLDRLEKSGYITRTGKQKARKIIITPKGHDYLGIRLSEESGVDNKIPVARSSQQKKVHQLLTDLSNDLGKIYDGGLVVLSSSSNPETIVQSAHSMREVVEMLAKQSGFKQPISLQKRIGKLCIDAKQESTEEELRKIIDEIKCTLSDRQGSHRQESLMRLVDPRTSKRKSELISEGIHKQINGLYGELADISHHRKKVSMDQYKRLLQEFDSLLLVALLPQKEVHTNIDTVLKSGPEDTEADNLRRLISLNEESKAYFYDNAGSEWMDFLMKNGLLPFEWEVGKYVAKIAPESPQMVLEYIKLSKDKKGVEEIVDQLIQAIGGMPTQFSKDGITIIRKKKWLHREYHTLGTHYAQDLFKKLLKEREFKIAYQVFCALTEVVRVKSGSNKARTVIEEYWLGEILRELGEIPADDIFEYVRTLIKRLEKFVEIERGNDYDDHSTIWRPSIEGSSYNWNHEGTDDHLLNAVRDGLSRLLDGTNGDQERIKIIENLVGINPAFAILTRIKLYAYLKISPKSEQVYEVLKKFTYDHDVWHEYAMLLKEAFPHLSKERQEELIEAFVRVPEDVIDDRREYWTARRLSVVREYLPKRIETKYKKYLKGFEKHDPTFVTGRMESWVGPQSPVSEDELINLTFSNIINEHMIGWTPPKDTFWGPSREGFSAVFRAVLVKRANDFSKQAMLLDDVRVRPAYIYGFFTGISEAVKQGQKIDWRQVLKLSRVIIDKAKKNKLPVFESETKQEERETGWDEVIKEVLRCVRDYMSDNDATFSKEARKICWEVISYGVTHPKPTPEYEEKYGGDNTDPFTMSINTVRGEAFHALFSYVFRVSREEKNNHLPEETLSIIKAGADPEKEHSLTVRSVYGRYLPWLIGYGKEWTEDLLPSLLPDDPEKRYAVWETYLSHQIFEDAFKILYPYYLKALDELSSLDLKRRYWVDPFDRLAEHIMIAYVYDVGKEAVELKNNFFAKAPARFKGVAISFAGRAYVMRDNLPPGHKLPEISKLTALWEERISTKNVGVEEMKEFGWWVKAGIFNDRWMLERLYETLRITEGEIDGEHFVLKTLANLSEEYPAITSKCLDLIARCVSNKDWTLQVYISEIKTVLKNANASGEEEAKEQSKKTIDFLLRLGFRELREIDDV